MLETIIKFVVAGAAALVTFMFGGWSHLLGLLLAFVVLDYVTGLIAAYVKGALKSEIGLKGIAKKIFIFAIVSVAHLIDQALGQEQIIFSAAVFFYIANEILSITENAGKAGIPVPEQIKRGVEILKGEKNHE
ncbi:phage holin family protein [Evansella tamaricis]|uniref:Phage holin family protein n=1 Tax=Evansella tamaricis TaxID=2069301 RepID=A0ABS6JBJ3_9BACI|nr:phage holin family protein [Evansella tamaricis]MBU9711047.1 phage holin family protein [Evansella tamaricis]